MLHDHSAQVEGHLGASRSTYALAVCICVACVFGHGEDYHLVTTMRPLMNTGQPI